MNFPLKMAWRDSRASRRRLVIFSTSIMLGIAALIASGSFCANLRQAIEEQSNGLLGADLVVSTFETPPPELEQYLAELGGEQAHEQIYGSTLSVPTGGAAPRMVQTHSIEGNFPFYGEFVTKPTDALQRLRQGGDVTIIDQSLAKQFSLHVGDTVQLGKDKLTVIGELERLSVGTQVEAMFMPRVYVPPRPMPAVAQGEKPQRRRHLLELKLPTGRDANAIVKEMSEKFKDKQLSYGTVDERKRDMEKALPNIDQFLSLVGFVALLLGAIGVASSLHVYVRQKLANVAVLRCLGMSVWGSFSIYLLQGIALGIAGAVFGAVIGVTAQWLIPFLLRDFIPLRIDFFLVWPAIGRGMGAGLVMSFLFALAPLLEVRRVSPLMALRSGFDEQNPKAADPWRILLGCAMVLTVLSFAIWLAPTWKVGVGFAVALSISFAVLAGVAKLTSWAARRWFPRQAPYVVRQGVANLYRPQNRTVLLLLSLGLGTFLILTLTLTRTTLIHHIEGPDGGNRPNLIIAAIKEAQIEPLEKMLPEAGARMVEKIPVLSMKLTSIRGQSLAQLKNGRNDRRVSSNFQRPYRATYRSELVDGERVVEGAFIGKAKPGDPVIPISIDQRQVRALGVHLGDEIGWDVEGVPIRTRLTSIKGWEIPRLTPDFQITFPVGALEGAPKTFVVTARAHGTEEAAHVQREVKDAFPGMQIIDITFFVQTLDRIFSKIAFVIEFLALSIVVTGLIMLVCAVLTGRFQRVRETVLLRTLGASRRQLLQIQCVEYAILGTLGAFVGCLLAVIANVLLAAYVFHATPQAPILQVIAAFGSVIAITLITGLVANRGVTDYPPLEVLRQET